MSMEEQISNNGDAKNAHRASSSSSPSSRSTSCRSSVSSSSSSSVVNSLPVSRSPSGTTRHLGSSMSSSSSSSSSSSLQKLASTVAPAAAAAASTSGSQSTPSATRTIKSGNNTGNAAAVATIDWNAPVLLPLTSGHIKHRNLCRFLSTQLGASVLINKLISGGIFLKHGSRGSPHYRYVWCSDDLKHINWGDLKKKKIHGTLVSNTVSSVVSGHSTKIMLERAPKSCDPHKCFSLLSASRTLDLEAISQQDRELWVLAFHFLIDFNNSQQNNINNINNNNRSLLTSSSPQQSTTSLSTSSVPAIKSISLVSALELLCDQTTNLENLENTNPTGNGNEIGEVNNGRDASSFNNDAASNGKVVNTRVSQSSTPNNDITNNPSSSSLSSASASSRLMTGDISSMQHLYAAIDEAKKRAEKLERSIERYKEDNRKLLISSARKMIKLQEQIDNILYENDSLRRQLALSSTDLPDDAAGSSGSGAASSTSNANAAAGNGNGVGGVGAATAAAAISPRDKFRSHSDHF